MTDRFTFDPPLSIADAKTRKRVLEKDIAEISRQLNLRHRKGKNGKPMSPQEYVHWAARAENVRVLKEAEHRFLKDWIVERRRKLTAWKLDIEDPNDPLDLLVATRTELLRARDQEDYQRLGTLLDIIDQFLNHAA